MGEPTKALSKIHSRCFDVPLALFLSAVTLILGLFLPIITLKELIFWKHTFSVLSGIISLWDERHYFLSLIILLFSIIFPFLKLLMLSGIWFTKMFHDQRQTYVKWLSSLGKWSMLDVFVVAVTIVIAKISNFASAKPHIGLYFFCFSILLAILTTVRIEKLMKSPRVD